MIEIWTDGGVIRKNPSPFGGTWAWVQVQNGLEVSHASGLVTCEEVGMERVTNNFTELLACVQALASLPDGWDGILYTDSDVSRIRLAYPHAKMNGIPVALREQLSAQRGRLGNFSARLVGGHPTRRQLAAGKRADGLPVSRWNQWCDSECQRLAKAWLEEKSLIAFKERHSEVHS